MSEARKFEDRDQVIELFLASKVLDDQLVALGVPETLSRAVSFTSVLYALRTVGWDLESLVVEETELESYKIRKGIKVPS